MKIDKKSQISEKSQMKLDKIVIIIGLSLVIASCGSYFIIEAFGQQTFILDCPKNAYHGVDGQGNESCRDILTNEILEPESPLITDLNLEKIIESDSQIIIVPETREMIVDYEQTPIIEVIIFVLIGIVGTIIGILTKKRILEIFQRHGCSIQKEQVRNRQYGKCNMCFTSPSQWKFNYFDGNKNNTDLNNCQGLCPDCFSIKTERDNRINIYQESN